jgi:hypothetical protein
MSIQAAGANNPNIQSVEYITYLQTPNSGPVHLLVNKTIYVGRYSTLEDAQSAVEGILQKLGSKDAANRRAAITTNTVDLTFSGDVTPSTPNWTDIVQATTVDLGLGTTDYSYGSTQVQITGIDTPINLVVIYTNANTTLEMWGQVSSATIAANTTTAPSAATGYKRLLNKDYLTVSNNEYVRFKLGGPKDEQTAILTTVSIINPATSTVLDTFLISHTYAEVGGV